MNDEKKVSLLFHCPNCSDRTRQSRSKIELEKVLEEGKIDLYHIPCNQRWTQELEPHEKINIVNLIKSVF